MLLLIGTIANLNAKIKAASAEDVPAAEDAPEDANNQEDKAKDTADAEDAL